MFLFCFFFLSFFFFLFFSSLFYKLFFFFSGGPGGFSLLSFQFAQSAVGGGAGEAGSSCSSLSLFFTLAIFSLSFIFVFSAENLENCTLM